MSTDGASQVDDVMAEVKDVAARGMRALITTLTKKMAEDLTEYLPRAWRARALHAFRHRHHRTH